MSTAAAPVFRRIEQFTGNDSRASVFFDALNEAGRRATDAELVRDAFARAVGVHRCGCGEQFEFTAESTIDDYAALNRWLGHHGRCTA
ncbi:hypothetical protein NLX62_05650 [Mycobacteriaceae bacterium Msp059]|nr:hypothetical protein [Mycobacteriaceae bacterium Msp059]